MKLTKMLTAVAVTSTVIAAMAMSASAAPDATTVTASYTAATDEAPAVITLANVPTRTGADDATLLVLNTDVFADFDSGASETVNITPAVIENINQSADTTDFASIPINALAEGDTVYVRMQVDGQIYTAAYTLPVTTPSYMLGDVTGNKTIDMGDAAAVLNHFTKDEIITDETAKLAADVTGNKTIDMGDAAAILNHFTKDELIVQPN